jgi:hypothetical protein
MSRRGKAHSRIKAYPSFAGGPGNHFAQCRFSSGGTDEPINISFMEAGAHGLSAIRLGRRAVPGQGRLVDALGKLAGWMGGDRAVATPWPGVRLETDLTDRIQRQMWAGMYEQHVTASARTHS